MITQHAADNIETFAKIIPGKYILQVLKKASIACRDSVSSACIVEMPPTKNPVREDWQISDRLCAIVRNRQVKTVMLTRKSQINKSHLRTERII